MLNDDSRDEFGRDAPRFRELAGGASAHPAIALDVRLSRAAATAPAIDGAAMVLQSELVPLHDGLRLPGNVAASEPPLVEPT